MTKVKNMISNKGNKIANQFIITDDNGVETFQSYNSVIARNANMGKGSIMLDEYYWNFSVTTSKYRNIFLNETTKETQQKIKSGEYRLGNLN